MNEILNIKSEEENKILHTPSTDVEQGENIKELKKKITSIFSVRPFCLGVAAPQVGVLKKVFIGQFGNNKSSVFPRHELTRLKNKNAVIMINPKIISKSEKTVQSIEGCLSIDDNVYSVPRPEVVEVSYENVERKPVTAILHGLDAYVFMHEYDHLMGITINQAPNATLIEKSND